MKKIVKSNLEANTSPIYLHDAILEDIKHDMKNQCMELTYTQDVYEKNGSHQNIIKKKIIIRFREMLLFELTNVSPLFSGDRVDNIFFEETLLLKRLHAIEDERGGQYLEELLEQEETLLLEPVISYVTGDRLRALCKSVEIEDMIVG